MWQAVNTVPTVFAIFYCAITMVWLPCIRQKMRPGCSNTKRKNQYSMYYAITHVRKKMTSFNISLEDIKNLHNCSVCLTVPRSGHIFQCDNGHLHCSSCHQKLKNKICPVCRIRLRESRNLVAEQTIEKYLYVLTRTTLTQTN